MVPAQSDMLEGGLDVRFGSKADMAPLDWDVRFTPESGHQAGRLPMSAKCQ